MTHMLQGDWLDFINDTEFAEMEIFKAGDALVNWKDI